MGRRPHSCLCRSVLLQLPLLLRTLALTAVAVPTVFYVIMPVYTQIFRKWLDRG